MHKAANGWTRRGFALGAASLASAGGLAVPHWALAQGRGKEIVVGGAGSHKAFLDPLIPVFEKQTGCKVLFEGTRSLVNLEKMVSNRAKPYMSVVLAVTAASKAGSPTVLR